MGNKLRIAIYMRLSKSDEISIADESSMAGKSGKGKNILHKDDAIKEDSNSIQIQRVMLKSYVQRNFSEYQLLEFSDDGYSGTNFDEVR